MKNIIKIGLAGLGVVGKSVYEIISHDAELLKLKSNHQLKIVAVSAKTAKNFVASDVKFYNNPLDLVYDNEIDVIIELIGGQDIAKQLIISALQNNKKVITANKALLACCGYELAKIANQHNGVLVYEASVAGSIPIIKAYQQGFLANKINKIYAILNGTCNFILSEMTNKKQDFLPSLKQAQTLGFAEADPTFDIEGIDTAHKISILASLASNTAPNFEQTYIEGITKITANDIKLANQLGYKIKLLATYQQQENNQVLQAVYPALISQQHKISQVEGSYNCILTYGQYFDDSFFVGKGAGGNPTASAVVADLLDIANNTYSKQILGYNSNKINNDEQKIISINQRFGQYLILFHFNKSQNNLAIENVFKGSQIDCLQASCIELDETKVLCGIITNKQIEQNIVDTLDLLDKSIIKEAKFIRVETF
jgi:homoserine dehydrogenase